MQGVRKVSDVRCPNLIRCIRTLERREIPLTTMPYCYQQDIMGEKAIFCSKAQWPHESSQYGQAESSKETRTCCLEISLNAVLTGNKSVAPRCTSIHRLMSFCVAVLPSDTVCAHQCLVVRLYGITCTDQTASRFDRAETSSLTHPQQRQPIGFSQARKHLLPHRRPFLVRQFHHSSCRW